jgi:hypothetical protein
MADNTTLNSMTGGDVVRDKDRAGVKTQIVALDLNPAGSETLMGGSMPVTGPLTDTQLRASAVPVSAASLPLPSGAATSAKQDTLAGLVGEVQASPTSNTVLDRLKQLLTGIILAAGENHVGGVHGWGFDVAVTPTVTNGAYSAGDIMGGLLTFANVARVADEAVVITGVQVVTKAAVLPNLTLIILDADPTSTTKTDNAAYSLNAADAFKVVGSVALGGGWYDHGTPNSVRLDNLGIVAKPVSAGRDLYGLLIDGTGVTLTSTGDIQVRLRGMGI